MVLLYTGSVCVCVCVCVCVSVWEVAFSLCFEEVKVAFRGWTRILLSELKGCDDDDDDDDDDDGDNVTMHWNITHNSTIDIVD